ncbi:MAG: class II aldolase/adducin family protein [Janthinobacterium lividum]
MTNTIETQRQELLQLSHQLGDTDRRWAILGEGNTSTRLDAETFLVKASGSRLGRLTSDQVAQVSFAPVLEVLESGAELEDTQVKDLLASAILGPAGAVPSVETLMHAYLLTLPGTEFVGHTHVTSINGLTCSVRGWDFLKAGHRQFPDEVVVCGIAPCCVPYVDPGVPLARSVREQVLIYLDIYGVPPKTIYLQNHGFIALGRSASEVEDIHQMADKSAYVLTAALSIGEPTKLTPENIARIYTWPAEHFRQKALGLTASPENITTRRNDA